jgi:hypothetical protein
LEVINKCGGKMLKVAKLSPQVSHPLLRVCD